MSAHQQMRRMLDELMGTRRNGEDTRKEKLHYRSTRVCKSFLLNCCPHEILAATRCDLGVCPRVHDIALKADFENSSRKDEYEFRIEALKHLKHFIAESERRIQIAKVRLAETQQGLTAQEAVKQEKLRRLDLRISDILARAEILGTKSDVDGSMKLMEEAEDLKKEKNVIEEEYLNTSINQQQKLRVCEVCSSYLGFNDNDKRLADHFSGRLHLGFLTIREKVEELENLVQEEYIQRVLDKEFGIKREKCPTPEKSPSKEKSPSRERSPSPEKKSSGEKSSSHHHRHKHKSHRSCHRSHKHRHRSKHSKCHRSHSHKHRSASSDREKKIQKTEAVVV